MTCWRHDDDEQFLFSKYEFIVIREQIDRSLGRRRQMTLAVIIYREQKSTRDTITRPFYELPLDPVYFHPGCYHSRLSRFNIIDTTGRKEGSLFAVTNISLQRIHRTKPRCLTDFTCASWRNYLGNVGETILEQYPVTKHIVSTTFPR